MIKEFLEISPSEKYQPTFMDLSGYPHYENVCSNILSFYFQSTEAHNLEDMMFNSLLISCGESIDDVSTSDMKVEREVRTFKNNRIDLVIETEDIIIGIENKIYADVYNDLENYSQFIDENCNDRRSIKILLSLYKVDSNEIEHFGFKNVTYGMLFSKVEELIGNYLLEADQKYVMYLLDFINTIKRLERGTGMNKEFLEFLSEKENDINKLLVDITDVRKELRLKLQDLSKLIDLKGLENIEQWYYREPSGELFDTLVHDIVLDDELKIGIDTILSASGWYFDIFPRGRAQGKYNDLIAHKNINMVSSYSKNRNRVEEEYGYNENLQIIASKLQELIDAIVV